MIEGALGDDTLSSDPAELDSFCLPRVSERLQKEGMILLFIDEEDMTSEACLTSGRSAGTLRQMRMTHISVNCQMTSGALESNTEGVSMHPFIYVMDSRLTGAITSLLYAVELPCLQGCANAREDPEAQDDTDTNLHPEAHIGFVEEANRI